MVYFTDWCSISTASTTKICIRRYNIITIYGLYSIVYNIWYYIYSIQYTLAPCQTFNSYWLKNHMTVLLSFNRANILRFFLLDEIFQSNDRNDKVDTYWIDFSVCQKMPKKNKIPEGWEKYTNHGKKIENSPFVAFKVPLAVSTWTTRKLGHELPDLTLVINLCNTSRYSE